MLFLLCTWFSHGLESEDHTSPRFCPRLRFFLLCSWFPHRLESEDHASLRFCPRLFEFRSPFLSGISRGAEQGCPRRRLFLGVGRSPWALMQSGLGPRIHLAHELRDISATFGHAVLSDVTIIEMRLFEAYLILGLLLTLEVEPEPFCL